jgi:hypothetical protein
MAVLRCAKQEYAGPGWLRHAPNSTFVCISYAALSLLRFCRPQFQKLHTHDTTILSMLDMTADVLGKISASPSHPAAHYSRFLHAMIDSQTDRIGATMHTPITRSPRQATSDRDFSQAPDWLSIDRDWPLLQDEARHSSHSQWSGIDSLFEAALDDTGVSLFWGDVLLPGLEHLSHPNGTNGTPTI